MAVKTLSKCVVCGYPLTAEYEGQIETCPMCGTINEAITGITIPDPIFWGGLGVLAGLILAKSKWVAGRLARV